MQNGDWPICKSPSQLDLLGTDPLGTYAVRCPRCGGYFIKDYAKDAIEGALQLDKRGIDTYLSMDDVSDNPALRLHIEVAKKAANGRGVDVPRSIISHLLRKRMDKRVTLTCDARCHTGPGPQGRALVFQPSLDEDSGRRNPWSRRPPISWLGSVGAALALTPNVFRKRASSDPEAGKRNFHRVY